MLDEDLPHLVMECVLKLRWDKSVIDQEKPMGIFLASVLDAASMDIRRQRALDAMPEATQQSSMIRDLMIFLL